MTKDKEPIRAEAAQPEYEAGEIAANAQALFGYGPDIAAAARKLAGRDRCALDKARSIIKTFAERKVK